MRLAENAARLRASLASLGVSCAGDATSHIVPVIVGGAARAAALGPMIAERGFAVGAVRPPTVPPGTSRLRLSVSAAHTSEQIAGVAQALADSLAACPT